MEKDDVVATTIARKEVNVYSEVDAEYVLIRSNDIFQVGLDRKTKAEET